MASKTTRRSIKNPKIFCGQCKAEVKEEEDAIQCDKCAKSFHSLCSMLDKRKYDSLMENENEEYICHICNEGGVNIKSELCLIKTKLNKLDQLDGLQDAMNFMSKQFDDIMKGIADNKKKLDVVQKENKLLKKEIVDLKKSVKLLNDNRVKNDCIVSGVQIVNDLSATETILSIMKNVDVELKTDEIDDAYFLNKKASTKQSLVVKFNSTKSKQKVMAAKSKLNENDTTKGVFINEFLSKETLTLLNHARALKSVGYRQVYATGGRVFVKRSELSKPKIIHDAEDVDNFLLEATNHMSRGSRTVDQDVNNIDESDGRDSEPQSPYLSPS